MDTAEKPRVLATQMHVACDIEDGYCAVHHCNLILLDKGECLLRAYSVIKTENKRLWETVAELSGFDSYAEMCKAGAKQEQGK